MKPIPFFQLFKNHTAHKIDQRFAHVASLLLILRETPNRQHTSGGWTVTESREKSRSSADQVSDSSLSKIKTLFFLKRSVFLPLGACLRSQDPGLDQRALCSYHDFAQDFLINNSSDCAKYVKCPSNSSHFSSMIVRPVQGTGNSTS